MGGWGDGCLVAISPLVGVVGVGVCVSVSVGLVVVVVAVVLLV